MTYREIISDNANRHSRVNWWPYFAYHFTDVTNAVSILADGCLYSRYDATRLHKMQNDNASRQVIDLTSPEIMSSVRLYFRPKTPTQYYNEGYKHRDLRFEGDIYANVPVPVFFVFDLEKILSIDDVQFSEKTQAGGGSPLYHTAAEFAELNFDQIYDDGYMKDPYEDKKYRQAEILVPGSLPLEPYLYKIVCRNEVEKLTLQHLLRGRDYDTFKKCVEQNLIVVSKDNMFEYNGLYITDCQYYNGVASISYSNNSYKKYYTERQKQRKNIQGPLAGVKAYAVFDWHDSKKTLEQQDIDFVIDYENDNGIIVRGLIPPMGAKTLYTKIYIDGNLMCCVGQQLAGSALL